MLQQLKSRIFPCTEKINKVIADNCHAADRLISACATKKNIFPPLKDGHIVNPR